MCMGEGVCYTFLTARKVESSSTQGFACFVILLRTGLRLGTSRDTREQIKGEIKANICRSINVDSIFIKVHHHDKDTQTPPKRGVVAVYK